MTGERLFAVVGYLDDDLIEEAEAAVYSPVSAASWKRWLGVAACAALICSLSFAWLITGSFSGFGASAPGESTAGSGSAAAEGTAFMSYAGPVLPLTTEEADTTALEVDRSIQFDLLPTLTSDAPAQQGAVVTDTYAISNLSAQTVTYNAVYPFTGSFETLTAAKPTVALNGTMIEATLSADHLDQNFGSWSDYETYLSSGEQMTTAVTATPALAQAVTVYAFTDWAVSEQSDPAAMQAVRITLDQTETAIFSYGFTSMSSPIDSTMEYGLPTAGNAQTSAPATLLVLGEDISGYTLQSYADGSRDTAIPSTCTVIRQETTLEAALAALHLGEAESTVESEMFSSSLFQGMLAQRLVNRSDSDSGHFLEEAFSLVQHENQIFYLSFPVTIAAGESITVTAEQCKTPSFDFGGSGTGNEGLQGYDLATTAGSSISFRYTSAAIVHDDEQTIVRQNFGFDTASGDTVVSLDPAQAHYYLELRSFES